MPTSVKKRPPIDEVPAEEVREGTESPEDDKQETDCEGCSGKKAKKCKKCSAKPKAMKDGDCGSKSKMDSTSSIYAAGFSVDPEELRIDLKCGNGAIAKGKKCTKGPATAVNTTASALETSASTVAKVGSLVNAGLAVHSLTKGNIKGFNRSIARIGGFTALEGAAEYARGSRTGSGYLKSRGSQKVNSGIVTAAAASIFSGDLNSNTLQNISNKTRRARQNISGSASARKSNVTHRKQKKEAWRGYNRSLLDASSLTPAS